MGNRPPAWPIMVSFSPVLPNTRLGISTEAGWAVRAAPSNPAPAEVEMNVLRRIIPSVTENGLFRILHNNAAYRAREMPGSAAPPLHEPELVHFGPRGGAHAVRGQKVAGRQPAPRQVATAWDVPGPSPGFHYKDASRMDQRPTPASIRAFAQIL